MQQASSGDAVGSAAIFVCLRIFKLRTALFVLLCIESAISATMGPSGTDFDSGGMEFKGMLAV
jgi:hypothetical protein